MYWNRKYLNLYKMRIVCKNIYYNLSFYLMYNSCCRSVSYIRLSVSVSQGRFVAFGSENLMDVME